MAAIARPDGIEMLIAIWEGVKTRDFPGAISLEKVRRPHRSSPRSTSTRTAADYRARSADKWNEGRLARNRVRVRRSFCWIWRRYCKRDLSFSAHDRHSIISNSVPSCSGMADRKDKLPLYFQIPIRFPLDEAIGIADNPLFVNPNPPTLPESKTVLFYAGID
jgi:hypothetical protein